MESLSSIECFVRSAEDGSFSAAARRLGLTPAAVSKSIAKLETRLSVLLFQRSTRRLTLTESGERFLREVSAGLTTIQTAVSNLASADAQPAGTLRVSLSPAFGRDYILPLLGQFLARYPAIIADFCLESRQVDLVAEGFDAAIGGGIELSSGVVARELARAQVVVAAAPAYLARRRAPKTPAELATHDCIARRSPQSGRLRPWSLSSRLGEQTSVELTPRIILSDADAVCHAAQLGLGVAMIPMPYALPHLRRGTLVRLLPDWCSDIGTLSIYFRQSRPLPKKTRAFVDFVVAEFRRQKLAAQLMAD